MMIQAVAMMDRVQGTNNAAMIAGAMGLDMNKMLPAEPAVPEKTEKAADITKTDSVGQKLREDHHVVKNAKDRAAASTAARS